MVVSFLIWELAFAVGAQGAEMMAGCHSTNPKGCQRLFCIQRHYVLRKRSVSFDRAEQVSKQRRLSLIPSIMSGLQMSASLNAPFGKAISIQLGAILLCRKKSRMSVGAMEDTLSISARK